MKNSWEKLTVSVNRLVLLFVLAILLSGCKALDAIKVIGSQEGKFFVTVDLIADKQLNTNAQTQSFPVKVQVFLMERDTSFLQADYFEFHNERAASISDLAKSVVIRPGSQESVSFEINEYVRFVGVVASFQDIDNAIWRDVIQVGDNRGFLGKYLSRNNHVNLQVNILDKRIGFVK